MTDQDRKAAEAQVRQSLLNVNGRLNFRLNVTGVLEREGWLHVIVEPDRGGVSVEDYVGILAVIEEQVKDDLGVNVLLVPAVPAD